MKNGRLIVCSIVAVLGLAACQSIARDPLFKLTLKVVDDEGRPVAGAKARIGAERRPQGDESGGKGVFVEGLTEETGFFSGEVEAWNATRAGYRVEKEGYYGVWVSYYAKSPIHGKWQPWNPTVEVVLKRKKDPVPMYAKRVLAEIPVSGVDVGYDLAAGDWIHPHGKGVVADIIFHSVAEVNNDRHYRGELTLSFPGPGNGLIAIELPERHPSPLRMPYQAPSDGYEPKRIWRAARKYNPLTMENDENHDDSSNTQNYFIRVRTELDAKGNIVKGMYGKIHAPFSYGPRGFDRNGATGKQSIQFVYYLNPDGTRNIEYDPSRNLLKHLNKDDPSYNSLAP